MSKPSDVEDVRRAETQRDAPSLPLATNPEELAELQAYASLRPRHPYVKGPWARSREADLAHVLVQHSDPED
jgi:hypothetical protein